MSLGKRPRQPMKRTSSVTEFSLDLNNSGSERDLPPLSPYHNLFNGGFSGSGAASPRDRRRISADLVEIAHFLRVCALCTRRLTPGQDIYMYRGDSAFCSVECRQHQITQDERKENKKCSFASKNEIATSASAAGETVTSAV